MLVARLSRREFLLASLGAVAAGVAPLRAPAALAGQRAKSNESSGLPRRVLADLHCHPTIDRWNARTQPALSADVPIQKLMADLLNRTQVDWRKSHEAGIDLLCVAHYNVLDEIASMPTDPTPEASYQMIRMLDQLEEELARDDVRPHARLARNRDEVARLCAVPKRDPAFRTAVVHAIEGGHVLGHDEKVLGEFARRGVFMITISHFFYKGVSSAPNPLPFFVDAGARPAPIGLTGFGREVIQEMNRLNIVIDVTHMTTEALAELLTVAKGPFIASHSGARGIADHPYNMVDEHIVALAERGCVIGVPIYPYMLSNYDSMQTAEKMGTLREVSRTLRYMYEVIDRSRVDLHGRKPHQALAIGSDFHGYIPHVKGMESLDQIGRLRVRVAEAFADLPDAGTIVNDIFADNVLRFMADHWGPRRP